MLNYFSCHVYLSIPSDNNMIGSPLNWLAELDHFSPGVGAATAAAGGGTENNTSSAISSPVTHYPPAVENQNPFSVLFSPSMYSPNATIPTTSRALHRESIFTQSQQKADLSSLFSDPEDSCSIFERRAAAIGNNTSSSSSHRRLNSATENEKTSLSRYGYSQSK